MEYQIGQRINHELFGNGTITKVEKREINFLNVSTIPDTDLVTVDFDNAMLTESEKSNWKINGPIKTRVFTNESLNEHAVIIK